jgi:hypothetical protein
VDSLQKDQDSKQQVVELLDQLDGILWYLAHEHGRVDDVEDIRQDLAVMLMERLCRSPTSRAPSEDTLSWTIVSLLQAPPESLLSVSSTFDRFADRIARLEELVTQYRMSAADLADELGVTPDRVRLARLVRRTPVSLAVSAAEALGSDDPPAAAPLEETLLDPQIDIEHQVIELLRERELLSPLGDATRSLLALRYGVNGSRVFSRATTARHLGFSHETVAALEHHALEMVRVQLARVHPTD